MEKDILGWTLIVVGFLFILLGFAGAVLTMFRPPKQRPADAMPIEAITKLIDAVTALIKALAAAPQWLALVVIGMGMVLYGSYLAL